MASLVRNMTATIIAKISENIDEDSLPPFQFLPRIPAKAIKN